MTRNELLAVAKPILFNTEMVKAILDEHKTETRRVMKPQPCDGNGTIRFERWFHRDHYTALARFGDDTSAALCDRKSPYQIGDILYVRETWTRLDCCCCDGDMDGVCFNEPDEKDGCYLYRATHTINGDARWHPSIHMPKEAARIFLLVERIWPEQLQDIDDAPIWPLAECPRTPKDAMKRLWNSIIKPADLPLYGWDANPWVWVIEFERAEANRNG